MLALESWIGERRNVGQTAVGLGDERICRAVIGIGALRQIVSLRKAHDDVAAVRAERQPDEAGRLRNEGISDLFLQLCGEQVGELVLEPFAFFIREGHVARIGTDAQHFGVDQFDREIAIVLWLLCQGRAAIEQAGERHTEDGADDPAMWGSWNHNGLQVRSETPDAVFTLSDGARSTRSVSGPCRHLPSSWPRRICLHAWRDAHGRRRRWRGPEDRRRCHPCSTRRWDYRRMPASRCLATR